MGRRSSRAAASPIRRRSAAAVRRELLVFREGIRTEELYLAEWHRRHRDRVRLTVNPDPAAPLQLVQRAVRSKQHEMYEAKRGRGRGRAHDQIWCLFDRDEHPNFDRAIALAAEHGIKVAVSNPCIELWFLLHFESRTAFIDRDDVQRCSGRLLGCGKTLSQAAIDTLIARYPEARARAQRLDAKHADDGSPEGSNPSTGVWRLIEEIRSA